MTRLPIYEIRADSLETEDPPLPAAEVVVIDGEVSAGATSEEIYDHIDKLCAR